MINVGANVTNLETLQNRINFVNSIINSNKLELNIELAENEWIEITGSIIKGDYNGEIPVIKINTITKIPAPANMYIEKK